MSDVSPGGETRSIEDFPRPQSPGIYHRAEKAKGFDAERPRGHTAHGDETGTIDREVNFWSDDSGDAAAGIRTEGHSDAPVNPTRSPR